jgi:hypothetical protein
MDLYANGLFVRIIWKLSCTDLYANRTSLKRKSSTTSSALKASPISEVFYTSLRKKFLLRIGGVPSQFRGDFFKATLSFMGSDQR